MGTNWNTGGAIKKHFLTVWVTRHGLPRETVESLFLEVFKSYLDMILGKQLWVALVE